METYLAAVYSGAVRFVIPYHLITDLTDFFSFRLMIILPPTKIIFVLSPMQDTKTFFQAVQFLLIIRLGYGKSCRLLSSFRAVCSYVSCNHFSRLLPDNFSCCYLFSSQLYYFSRVFFLPPNSTFCPFLLFFAFFVVLFVNIMDA